MTLRFVLIFLLTLMLFSVKGIAQQKKWLHYAIVSKGDTIGHMQMQQTIGEEKLGFSVKSEVTVKALFTIHMKMQEETQFANGNLLFSSIKRYTNEKLKINKQTKWSGDHYVLVDGDEQTKLNTKAITYNFAMLFYKEPTGIFKIYSDTYQKFFVIQSLSNHVYKIDLPDNATNTYYYENEILKKVNLKNTFFSAQMILN